MKNLINYRAASWRGTPMQPRRSLFLCRIHPADSAGFLRVEIKKNPLFFAFFFPALIDGIVTLIGQGSQYWTPSRVVNEASPVYYILLCSPWLFSFGSVLWFVFWYWLFKRLREPLNLFLMVLFIAGHFWGSAGWIQKILKQIGFYTLDNQPSIILSYFILILYLVLISITATYCLGIYLKKRK